MSIRLINGKSEKELIGIDNNSIDLVITSPPYDNLRQYNNTIGLWNENTWKQVICGLFKVLKPGGVVIWIVGDATINGTETGTSFRQALFAKKIGFNLHDTMLYIKRNPIPLTHNRYEQAFEYIFVWSKNKPKTFNPIREKCIFAGKNKKITMNSAKVEESAIRNRNEGLVIKDTKIHKNLWEYALHGDRNSGSHPAPFPLELAKDQIISWSNKGDTVLDPFMGSGTTGSACLELDRNFIGIELVPEYYNIAQKRLLINESNQ
jgi:site-specific DNA-methyltransferase (adenine-specific)